MFPGKALRFFVPLKDFRFRVSGKMIILFTLSHARTRTLPGEVRGRQEKNCELNEIKIFIFVAFVFVDNMAAVTSYHF